MTRQTRQVIPTARFFGRSTRGDSWTEERVGPDGFPDRAVTLTDWTALELPDPQRPGKTLVQLGVSIFQGGELAPANVFLWRSGDSGRDVGKVASGRYRPLDRRRRLLLAIDDLPLAGRHPLAYGTD